MKQFYLAGAYTAESELSRMLNIRNAMLFGLKVMEVTGWFPIVPHCSMDHDTEWSPAMETCIATVRSLVPGRDVVVLLPNWRESRGATAEEGIARCLGIEVLEIAEVLK